MKNYAQQLRDTYYENKDQIAEHRRKLGISYVLTLEDKLKDGYKAYTEFCYAVGIQPKRIMNFLRTEVI
ncbi:hypothetical protein [Acinetobacter sp.]|uniref:hypothetical protein n=1 Tax=Acinetobacter sp. TaxID=472 RepID=UPI003D07C81B